MSTPDGDGGLEAGYRALREAAGDLPADGYFGVPDEV